MGEEVTVWCRGEGVPLWWVGLGEGVLLCWVGLGEGIIFWAGLGEVLSSSGPGVY